MYTSFGINPFTRLINSSSEKTQKSAIVINLFDKKEYER